MKIEAKFSRQEAMFGEEGQARIQKVHAGIAGAGGIGTHEAQQLALLGVAEFTIVDPEELSESNRNRYIGHHHDDPVPGTSKIEIVRRMILSINPDAIIHGVPHPVESDEAVAALANVDVIFGCLDHEAPRFLLNELASKLDKPFIDAATEIMPGERIRYGGRVFVCWKRPGCLLCCNVLDMEEVNEALASSEERANRKTVYGVEQTHADSGPSVVSINGIVASIAITEFMVALTGLREPIRLISYYGEQGRFTRSIDSPREGCYACQLAGQGASVV